MVILFIVIEISITFERNINVMKGLKYRNVSQQLKLFNTR